MGLRPAGWLIAAFAPILYEWALYCAQVARLSYGLLVPVLAAILAVLATRAPAGAAAVPASWEARGRWLSPLLLALGGVLLLLGAVSALFTLSVAGFPLAVAGWLGSSRGGGSLFRFRYALLMLAAMVPPPLPLLDAWTPALVQASGDAAVWMLGALDPAGASWKAPVLHFREHTVIVAEACSGSGSMLVLAVLCLFLAGLFGMRIFALGLCLALVVPLTIFVNGLRIALTAWALDVIGPAAVQGRAHEALGQVLVILTGAGLAFGVDRLSRRRGRNVEARA